MTGVQTCALPICGEVRLIRPREDDPCEYAILTADGGKDYAYTLAGAANLLGYVPEGDYAYGIPASNAAAWDALGHYLGSSGKQAAQQVVDLAMGKLSTVVDSLIAEYGLDRSFTTLVGGGGSGAVIVNALAEKMGVKCQMAKNAPYISTIGVALAMVREQMERTIANPTNEDIKRIRADIIEKIVRSGAKEWSNYCIPVILAKIRGNSRKTTTFIADFTAYAGSTTVSIKAMIPQQMKTRRIMP